MVLKAYDRLGIIKCTYTEEAVFPAKSEVDTMIKAGYSFKLDGKKVSNKKLKEVINTISIQKKVAR